MSSVALVTGGGTGIGAAIARRLSADGYDVAVTGRRAGPVEDVAAEVDGLAVVADMGVAADAERAVAETVERFGGLDALVLNAGIGGVGSLLELEPEVFEDVLRVNVTGAFLTARAAIPHLLDRGGVIVSIASVSALRAAPGSLAYCSSKAALAMLTQCIALDHGSDGVRANCLCPGWVRTPMADSEMDALGLDSREGSLRRRDAGRSPAAPERAGGDRCRRRVAPLGGCLLPQRRGDPGRRRRLGRRRRQPRVREGAESRSPGLSRLSVAGVDVSPDHFIGGERVPSDRDLVDLSPIDGQPLGEIARGGQPEAQLAVAAAQEAFPALGGARPGRSRRASAPPRRPDRRERRASRPGRVRRHGHAAPLAEGAPDQPWRAQLPQLRRSCGRLRGAGLGLERHPQPRRADAERSRGRDHALERALHALHLEDRTRARRRVHGDPEAGRVVPLSCSLLADLTVEAGFPPGVFNVVQGIGEEVGAALVSHPGVRRISFTGSPETARHIGVAAAQNIVPFTGELGGKGPLLVFEDCDLEAAARKAAGQYDDAGQVCLAGTRLLVQESVADPFLELFHRFSDEHVLGDPRADDTTVTPLIHRDHLERVAGFVERARANGDEIVRGGHRAERGGLFYEPTLVVPVRTRARSCNARSSDRC